MIISRTPYRVSFFGGGTDYHTWYQEHGGAVLATTIDHYCYLTCRYLPPFFNHKSRVVWTKTEEVNSHDDIQHPAVKATLEFLEFKKGVEIQHQGGLPARSGLGSSSTFTVGLLNALYGLRGQMSSHRELACEAVHIEREMLKENVGVQDQISAAYGGFNKITILPNGDFDVDPILLNSERSKELESNMLLFFTGVSRTASEIAGEQMKTIPKKLTALNTMREMVDEAISILKSERDIEDFGKLMHESWQLKKSISDKIAPAFVDDIYERAMKAGATGGKILGAGGGGFILFFVKPEYHQKVLDALSELLLVPFGFESGGSQIIFYDKPKYSQTSMVRRDFMHLQGGEEEKEEEEVIIKQLNKKRKSKLTVIS